VAEGGDRKDVRNELHVAHVRVRQDKQEDDDGRKKVDCEGRSREYGVALL
jgi:hypothetical protein